MLLYLNANLGTTCGFRLFLSLLQLVHGQTLNTLKPAGPSNIHYGTDYKTEADQYSMNAHSSIT